MDIRQSVEMTYRPYLKKKLGFTYKTNNTGITTPRGPCSFRASVYDGLQPAGHEPYTPQTCCL